MALHSGNLSTVLLVTGTQYEQRRSEPSPRVRTEPGYLLSPGTPSHVCLASACASGWEDAMPQALREAKNPPVSHCMYVCTHTSACQAWAHVCTCDALHSALQGLGGAKRLVFLGWQFCGSVPLGARHSPHILVFLTAVLPAAVTQLKNRGPCDCSETRMSRTRGHFAIPAH